MFSYIVAIVWCVVTVECEVSHRKHEVYHRLCKIDSDTAAEESGNADERCKQSEQEEVPEIALCHVPTLLERTCESVFRVFQDVTSYKEKSHAQEYTWDDAETCADEDDDANGDTPF